MQNISPWLSLLGAALLLSACQDATEPSQVPITLKASSGSDTECNGALTGPVFGNVVVPPGAACVMTDAIVYGNVKALEGSILNLLGGNIIWGDVEGVKTSGFAVGESVVHGDVRNTKGSQAFIFQTRLTNGNIELEKMTGNVGLEDNILEKGSVKLADIVGGAVIGLSANSVAGNVQVLKSFVNDYSVGGNVIGGGLEISKNEARFDVEIIGNIVGENLRVFKNVATTSISVTGNNVGEDLECKKNTAPVFVGQPNVVGGIAEGQCAGPGTV